MVRFVHRKTGSRGAVLYPATWTSGLGDGICRAYGSLIGKHPHQPPQAYKQHIRPKPTYFGSHGKSRWS